MGLRLKDACYGFCGIWENAEALLYGSVPTARLQLASFVVFYIFYLIIQYFLSLSLFIYYTTLLYCHYNSISICRCAYIMQYNFAVQLLIYMQCRSEQLLLRDQITHSNAQLAAYFTKPQMLLTTDLSSARRTVLCLHSTYHIGWQKLCASDFIPFALHEQSSAFQTFFLSCMSNLLPLCEDRTRVHISNS